MATPTQIGVPGFRDDSSTTAIENIGDAKWCGLPLLLDDFPPKKLRNFLALLTQNDDAK
jgi:hypothetical protein